MATYSVLAGGLASHDNALVASTVDTVTFVDSVAEVEVMTDGMSAVYFTVDGTTPTVSGAHCYKIPLALSALTVNVPNPALAVVKLISAGTPVYSVTAMA